MTGSDAGRPRRLPADVRAARYAFALAIVVCLAIGVYLTFTAAGGIRAKLSDLGINLIASAVFSAIFALLVDRENRSVVGHELDEKLARHTATTLDAISHLNADYLPVAVHPPMVEGYDPVFNRTLMTDLNRSSFYYFRGPSAKYVAARLSALRRRPDLVRIYVPGPGSTASIGFDIANRSRTTEALADVATLHRRFGNDLLAALLGLFDCRAYGRIEVFLGEDTLVSRYEVTEQHLFTSWYTSLENLRGGSFPETSAFPRSSLHHQAMMIDMERRAQLAERKLVIGPDVTAADFTRELNAIFGTQHTEDELREITARYWADRAAFVGFLKRL